MTTGLGRYQNGSVNMTIGTLEIPKWKCQYDYGTQEIPKWKCQYDYRDSGDPKMEKSI